jgi:hypothetical protein
MKRETAIKAVIREQKAIIRQCTGMDKYTEKENLKFFMDCIIANDEERILMVCKSFGCPYQTQTAGLD